MSSQGAASVGIGGPEMAGEIKEYPPGVFEEMEATAEVLNRFLEVWGSLVASMLKEEPWKVGSWPMLRDGMGGVAMRVVGEVLEVEPTAALDALMRRSGY